MQGEGVAHVAIPSGGRRPRLPAKSLWRFFTALVLTERDRKRAVSRLGDAAERASRWLWLRREKRSWQPSTNT
ncbi:hypothetical protein DPMN_146270 [Dreissena polymorpha]|uniref:Uncharacterized protein n=1 Tax=Dreissena polymorpha TaxID=45954 RepID=A0A9D4IY97_DREPO|nr:hypothetical protein DPMN_146270 [Dreissena polymorpha]